MIISCNMIVDRRDHVQYLTVSKSYSDNYTCSLTEQKNITLTNLYYCLAHRGLPVGFLLLRYSVLFTVESLSLLYLLVIS